ncbi:MAG: glycosyltransferase family 4 protein [Flavobacteriaceae bacterium]|jgi:glycosyltransferase involved in cell wall biosynthesis|nr:glycosyltransferase family 4 protein [Flavobacteriaceae bacterium]
MKIAYDAKRFFQNSSGLGNYSRDLIRMLARFFPENEYVLFNKKQTEKGAEILELPGVKFLKTSKGNLSRQMKTGLDAQNQNVDIFHGLSGELPLKWNQKPIKKIVTIHDLIFMKFPQYYSFFDRKIHFWKFKKAARIADKIVAISEQTKKDIVHYLKIPEEKIDVVYQGCHQSFKENYPPSFFEDVKNKFKLPERFVLNVGTIEERKNLLNVVKALKNSKIPLIVVGKKTKYFKKVNREILAGGTDVRFLENVSMPELAAIYQLADIFVYPSFYEGFGIPIIESLFSKTVVVTSNSGCFPEAGGKDSVYVNPKNVEDIRSKILFLWENESERKRRSEKGFEFVQKFNDETIAKEMMAVYLSLI